MESEILVETSRLNLISFVLIDNLPSLIGSIVSSVDLNVLSFSIFSTSNIKGFVVLDIDEVFTIKLEDLPPSTVSVPHLHI